MDAGLLRSPPVSLAGSLNGNENGPELRLSRRRQRAGRDRDVDRLDAWQMVPRPRVQYMGVPFDPGEFCDDLLSLVNER
jgi:hypothetical protein